MQKTLITLSVCALLTACGGGSSSSEVKTDKLTPVPTLNSGVYLTTLSNEQDILRTDDAAARFLGVAVVLSETENGKQTTGLFGNTLEKGLLDAATARHSVSFIAESESVNDVATTQFQVWGSAPSDSEESAPAAPLATMPTAAPEVLQQQWLPELNSLGVTVSGQALKKQLSNSSSSLLFQAVTTLPAVEFIENRTQSSWQTPAQQTYPGYYNQYQLDYRGKDNEQQDVLTINAGINGMCNIAANGELADNNIWLFSSEPMDRQLVDDCRAELALIWPELSLEERELRIRQITEKSHSFAVALVANANGEPLLAVTHFVTPDDVSSFSQYPVNLSGHGLLTLTK